jgi:uncharacterized protein (TIGR00369 family)
VTEATADAGRVAAIFDRSPFMADLGVELVGCGPGWCEARLAVAARHRQFLGVVHAGVVAALADHTAGAAAVTLLAAGTSVVTAEFKINLLRPGRDGPLTCRANVRKSGRQLSFVEAEVFARRAGETELIATFTATMAAVADP